MKCRPIFYLIFITASCLFISSCDDYEDDLQLEDEQLLQIASERQVTPGGSILFDLKQSSYSTESVTFGIVTTAEKGELAFIGDGFLKYAANPDFTSGQDFFSLSIESNGEILDIDTIGIEAVSDTSMVDCFNGAISDYYRIDSDKSEFVFNPLKNDGLCQDEIQDIAIEVEQPALGSVVVGTPDSLIYRLPDAQVGIVEFMYTTMITDLEEKVYESAALITLELVDVPDSSKVGCDIWPSLALQFQSPFQSSYEFQVEFPDPACTVPAYSKVISSVSEGLAVFDEQQVNIIYTPEASPDSVVLIDYQIIFEDNSFLDRRITLLFDDEAQEEECVNLLDDNYVFDRKINTAEEVFSWIFDPVANDDYCESQDDFLLNIVKEPEAGVLQLNSDQTFTFFSESAIDSAQNVTAAYEFCLEQQCDTARIYFTVF